MQFLWLFTLQQMFFHESAVMLIGNINIQACDYEGFTHERPFYSLTMKVLPYTVLVQPQKIHTKTHDNKQDKG